MSDYESDNESHDDGHGEEINQVQTVSDSEDDHPTLNQPDQPDQPDQLDQMESDDESVVRGTFSPVPSDDGDDTSSIGTPVVELIRVPAEKLFEFLDTKGIRIPHTQRSAIIDYEENHLVCPYSEREMIAKLSDRRTLTKQVLRAICRKVLFARKEAQARLVEHGLPSMPEKDDEEEVDVWPEGTHDDWVLVEELVSLQRYLKHHLPNFVF